MAVLGSQVVITMIFASLMSKVGPFFSLGRWILSRSGLVRYVHPSDEELRQLAMIPRTKVKPKKQKNFRSTTLESQASDIFNVPRNLDVQLDKTPVTVMDVAQLRFYTEYEWLIDFSLYSTIVYAITELYIFFLPERAALETFNLSMVWCLLVAGLAYKLLLSLNSLYFQGDDSGERSLVIVMAFVYLFLAMLVLIVEEDTLETGLDDAYASFNQSAAMFLADNSGLDSSGPASKLVLKFFLALWCSSIGALFTFPGLRLARMQWDVLQHSEGNGLVNVCLHLSFISPLLLTTLWIKPLSRDYLTEITFRGMEEPFLTSAQFETLRIYFILAVICFRIVIMPRYLQSYLNVAFYKMEELKQEAGKISNVEMQKIVARVFYYLCVVTLQYVAPMVIILSLTLMYKTMGGGCWSGFWMNDTMTFEPQPSPAKISQAEDVSEEQFSLAWQSLKQVFTTSVFRGLLGFSLWWCCLAWFASSAIGITYQSYFSKV